MHKRLITREKLCEAIKISDSSLRKYISRGTIIEEQKGLIDLDNEKNKVCIINYASKKGVDAESLLYTFPVDAEIETDNDNNEGGNESVTIKKNRLPQSELQRIKLEKDIQKIEVETRLKNLELEKKKAKVLPLEFIIEWSALNIRGVFGETVNFGNSIIEDICNLLESDIETKLQFKKKFKEGFNEILNEGIKNQKPEAIKHAKEYSLLTKW